MSATLNRAQVLGNVTRDPELKTTPNGQKVATFGVATNQRWTDSSGQKQERPEFHHLVAWGKLADICATYLRKGSKVYAEGRLQTREWQAQDGSKRQRTEIVLEQMVMLSPKTEAQQEPQSVGTNTMNGEEVPIDVADIPF